MPQSQWSRWLMPAAMSHTSRKRQFSVHRTGCMAISSKVPGSSQMRKVTLGLSFRCEHAHISSRIKIWQKKMKICDKSSEVCEHVLVKILKVKNRMILKIIKFLLVRVSNKVKHVIDIHVHNTHSLLRCMHMYMHAHTETQTCRHNEELFNMLTSSNYFVISL